MDGEGTGNGSCSEMICFVMLDLGFEMRMRCDFCLLPSVCNVLFFDVILRDSKSKAEYRLVEFLVAMRMLRDA